MTRRIPIRECSRDQLDERFFSPDSPVRKIAGKLTAALMKAGMQHVELQDVADALVPGPETPGIRSAIQGMKDYLGIDFHSMNASKALAHAGLSPDEVDMLFSDELDLGEDVMTVIDRTARTHAINEILRRAGVKK